MEPRTVLPQLRHLYPRRHAVNQRLLPTPRSP